ncbi:FixH family protein [Sphingobacterium suaedae]|uniref:FixH family protein n=1 Tax=Sphingobacterium suaedae TaxID=1686402 RepID=A0ABW5KDQ1_9SPHI
MKSVYFGKVSMLLGIAAIALVYSLTGCGNNTQQTQEKRPIDTVVNTVDISTLTKIADTTLTDNKVSVFAQDSLRSKNETIYIQVTDLEGNPTADAHLDYDVIMDMGMMSHGGPYYPLVDLGNGLFKAEVVFIMANMDDMGEGWILHTILNKKDSLSFLLPVSEAKYVRTISVNTKDDSRVFVSLLLPEEVKAGTQPIGFTLHKMDHNLFPALEGYTVEIEPLMPNMGHGSPNNEAATGTGNGRYSGTINFTMKGHWKIKVNLLKGGEKVSQEELVFPVEAR